MENLITIVQFFDEAILTLEKELKTKKAQRQFYINQMTEKDIALYLRKTFKKGLQNE